MNIVWPHSWSVWLRNNRKKHKRLGLGAKDWEREWEWATSRS